AVINKGEAGECVLTPCPSAGVVRLPSVLASDSPQVLLLQEGINDINGGGAAAVPNVVSGLRTMIGQARSRDARVFLGTLLPERVGACRGYAPGLIASANDQIRALAQSEGVDLVDLYAAFGGEASTALI